MSILKPLILEVRVGRGESGIYATATPGYRLTIERDPDPEGRVTVEVQDNFYAVIDAPGSFTFVAAEKPAEKETEPKTEDEGETEHKAPVEDKHADEAEHEEPRATDAPATDGTTPPTRSVTTFPPRSAPPFCSTAHTGAPSMARLPRFAPLGTGRTGTVIQEEDDLPRAPLDAPGGTDTPDGTDAPEDPREDE